MNFTTLLDFQINRIGYQFKNVDLLQEALTHSLDEIVSPFFPCQNRTYHRLQVIGNAVIKLTLSQYVVEISDKCAGEGELTKRKEELINGNVQKIVGEWLLKPEGGDVYRYIRVGTSSKLNFAKPGGQVPYEKFVRALMGAVFLDSGGVAGEGLRNVAKVFFKVWGQVLEVKSELSVQTSFPPPPQDIQEFWEGNGVDDKFIGMVQEAIGVRVGCGYLLGEALIQKTFYDTLPKFGQRHLPDYQRLEFLGDSVLGMVICELVWLEEDAQYVADGLDYKIMRRIESKALKRVFLELGLGRFVKMKAGGIPGWSNEDDIVEAVVGAVFVDGGGPAAMQFIRDTWKMRDVGVAKPDLMDLQAKLGYKFQNTNFLISALSHPSVMCNVKPSGSAGGGGGVIFSKEARSMLTWVGKAWIKFHASDYILRTCNSADNQPILEAQRDYLSSSQSVLLKIGGYLGLSKYVEMSGGQVSSGMEPFMVYEDIVYALCGAIFKDMQESRVKNFFGKVFYRLWNQFLTKVPTQIEILKELPQNFASTGGIVGRRVEEIGKTLRHNFTHAYFLEKEMFTQFANKFLFIGDAICNLTVSAYVVICMFLELQKNGGGGGAGGWGPSTLMLLEVMHSETVKDCVLWADSIWELEHLNECLETTYLASVDDDKFVKCMLGAVYIDMSAESDLESGLSSGAEADQAFAKWKQYFMNTCNFINGRKED